MSDQMLRPELTDLPLRLRGLPLDARGYPVPWFVQWVIVEGEGKPRPVDADTPGAVPEFRIMDHHKWVQALTLKRCWVCGDALGVYKTFVVGPMCGVNRTTGEPPCHLECARWSAINCPFLSRPVMERRGGEAFVAEIGAKTIGGMGLTRNPGVTLLWTTRTFTVWKPAPGEHLIEMGEPTSTEWYAEGRAATRAEIEASVTSGLPALRQLAEEQDAEEPHAGARAALTAKVAELRTRYPVEEGATP